MDPSKTSAEYDVANEPDPAAPPDLPKRPIPMSMWRAIRALVASRLPPGMTWNLRPARERILTTLLWMFPWPGLRYAVAHGLDVKNPLDMQRARIETRKIRREKRRKRQTGNGFAARKRRRGWA
jgi:hypothetical protein